MYKMTTPEKIVLGAGGAALLIGAAIIAAPAVLGGSAVAGTAAPALTAPAIAAPASTELAVFTAANVPTVAIGADGVFYAGAKSALDSLALHWLVGIL